MSRIRDDYDNLVYTPALDPAFAVASQVLSSMPAPQPEGYKPITTMPLGGGQPIGGVGTDLGASRWETEPNAASWNMTANGAVSLGNLPDAPNIPQPIMVNPAGGTSQQSSPVGGLAVAVAASVLGIWIWEKAKAHKLGKGERK